MCQMEQAGNPGGARASGPMTSWRLAEAARSPANLLLNTGPAPDGTIHPPDEATLREVGRRVKTGGFPSASPASAPPR